MNHQYFVDLIFKDPQDLSAEQALSLQEHMDGCEHCEALAFSYRHLESAISDSGVIAPAPGFAARWEARYEAERSRIHRFQIVAMLAVVGGTLVLLFSTLLFLIWPYLRSPNILLWTWVYQLFAFYSYLDIVRDIVSSLLSSSNRAIPLIAWVFSLGIISELAVLWVVSYRLLTNPRRATQ